MKKLLFAMLIGAALMWLYDPVSGSQRRDKVQRKMDRGSSGSSVNPPVRLADLDVDRLAGAAVR